MNDQDQEKRELSKLLANAGLEPLTTAQEDRFASYLDLLVKWNARMNLTAIRQPSEILTRHFVECIACARSLPGDIRSLLDFGSGAGFPGIPISICRPEIFVTLAESQVKKAGFLNEVRRVTGLGVDVFAGRAESIQESFDCVAMRAVDRMREAIQTGSQLVNTRGYLALLITTSSTEEAKNAAGASFDWREPVKLPGSEQRVLVLGSRAGTAV